MQRHLRASRARLVSLLNLYRACFMLLLLAPRALLAGDRRGSLLFLAGAPSCLVPSWAVRLDTTRWSADMAQVSGAICSCAAAPGELFASY